MTPEIITLTIISGVSIVAVAFLAAYHLGSSFMAANVATLRKELEVAYGRISILETERANDRIVVKAVQEENYLLRHELETLRTQVKTLTDKYTAAEQRANEWQQTAHDWQQASRGK